MTEINVLGWIDYVIVAMTLCINTGIGIYYRFSGGRQKTTEEYFVANRSMSSVPIAIAMVVSFISGGGMLGIPAENYIYGTQFVVVIIPYLLGTCIICYGFLLVFFNMQVMSVYEYLEKRFGVRTRMMASFAYSTQQLLYSGLVLYAPSIALEATTGIPKTVSIIIIGLVCAFYSSIGGIKAMLEPRPNLHEAVLVTDVLQSALVFIAVVLVIGIAAKDVGGLKQIWEIARQGHRLEFVNINLDPTVRLTTWSILLSGLCTFLSLYGVSQVQIQRMMTVKRTDDSTYFYLYRISYMWFAFLGFLITFILGLLVSNLIRFFVKNENEELDTNLFFPVIARRICKRQRNCVKNKRSFPLGKRYSFSDLTGRDNAADKMCTLCQ